MSARPVLVSILLDGPDGIEAVERHGGPIVRMGEAVLHTSIGAPDAAASWRAVAAAAEEAADWHDRQQAEGRAAS